MQGERISMWVGLYTYTSLRYPLQMHWGLLIIEGKSTPEYTEVLIPWPPYFIHLHEGATSSTHPHRL
jgi:hypothetical protein